jgi:hypothetical protein
MFVPSLSWQNVRFSIKTAQKWRFLTCIVGTLACQFGCGGASTSTIGCVGGCCLTTPIRPCCPRPETAMFMQARQTLPSATPAAAAAPPGWTRSMMGSFCACEPRGNAFPLRPVLMRENLICPTEREKKQTDEQTDRWELPQTATWSLVWQSGQALLARQRRAGRRLFAPHQAAHR